MVRSKAENATSSFIFMTPLVYENISGNLPIVLDKQPYYILPSAHNSGGETSGMEEGKTLSDWKRTAFPIAINTYGTNNFPFAPVTFLCNTAVKQPVTCGAYS